MESHSSPHYYATVHKSTAVTACVSGNLTSPMNLSLIVAKNTELELYAVSPEGELRLWPIPIKDLSIFGKITILKLFRYLGDKVDKIFVVTAKYHAMILELRCSETETETGTKTQDDHLEFKIVTVAHGNMGEPSEIPSKSGVAGVVDPDGRVIGLKLFEGFLKIIPLDRNKTELSAFNIHLYDPFIQDIGFLFGCSSPTIITIHQDSCGRQVRAREISLEAQDFSRTLWKEENVESSHSALIIPVSNPLGGAIVLGEESILYHNGKQSCSVAKTKTATILCYARVRIVDSESEPEHRYLLGDSSGRLYMLILEGDETQLDIKLELLGDISTPECITFLGNGIVYIGSRLGDSQLIKLRTEPDDKGKFVTLLETFTNLGPIHDMVFVSIGDGNKLGQEQLVTCSGAGKDGSLRIIRRNAVQTHVTKDVAVAGIKGIWPLNIRGKGNYDYDNVLVVSRLNDTRFLRLSEAGAVEVWEETDLIDGFQTTCETLWASNVCHAQIVQVTSGGIFLVDTDTDPASKPKRLLTTWKPPSGNSISAVAGNNSQIICAAAGSELYYLEIDKGSLSVVAGKLIDEEVAALDITPIPIVGDGNGKAHFAAVSAVSRTNGDADTDTNTASAFILGIPFLDFITIEPLHGDATPGSILLASFDDGHSFLIVALADGSLLYFALNAVTGSLTNMKSVTLGAQPSKLKFFRSQSSTCPCVFASSDRPTVISWSNDELVFADVNLGDQVSLMCPLNLAAFAESLAFATESSLTILTISPIQKLDIEKVALGETPRRIAYQASSKTFGVLTMRVDVYPGTGTGTGTGTSTGAGGQFVPLIPSASTLSARKSYTSSEGKLIDPSASTTTTTTTTTPSCSSFQRQAAAAATSSVPFVDSDSDSDTGQQEEVHSLVIIDQRSFEILHSHQLMPMEHGMSITSCKLGKDPTDYYVVGTATIFPGKSEPTEGRVLIFQFQYSEEGKGRLQQVGEEQVHGGCTTLAGFKGKLLVGINTTVRLFEWTSEKELQVKCSYYEMISCQCIKTNKFYILLGDLMRSMTLLKYKKESFQVIADDYNPHWMTALDFLDDDIFLGADNCCNLLLYRTDCNAASEEERSEMEDCGGLHIGETVNCIRRGSLAKQNLVGTGAPTRGGSGLLFGTASGAIGSVTPIPEQFCESLMELQDRLRNVIQSVGKIEHSEWRSFSNDQKQEPASGFVDGDLIERFLDLSGDDMREVVQGLQIDLHGSGTREDATVEDVIAIVQVLTRIH